jgi:hypothetical protein
MVVVALDQRAGNAKYQMPYRADVAAVTLTGMGSDHRSVDNIVITDRPHLGPWSAAVALARCVLRTAVLLTRREVAQPSDHLGDVVLFGDGTRGRVYRETRAEHAADDEPVVLVVAFRLRWVRGRGHALFRAESLLNTPLFAGFPGFVSKLWMAHDENNLYRGLYQWNGAERADAYVRALWWVLALVSERSSIRYTVLPGLRRDDVLTHPRVLDTAAPGAPDAWWRPIAIEQQTKSTGSGTRPTIDR